MTGIGIGTGSDGVDSLHQQIAENARAVTGAQIVAVVERDVTGRRRLAAWAGGAEPLQRALDLARRIIPGFAPAQTWLPMGTSEELEQVYRTGEASLLTYRQASEGSVDPRLLGVAEQVFGLRFSYVCPVSVGGRVAGSVSFHLVHAPDEREQAVCRAFASQVSATLENAALAGRLRESEQQLRHVSAQLPAVTWTTDATEQLCLTSASGAGLTAAGVKPEDLVGKPLEEVVEPPSDLAVAPHRLALLGEEATYELRWRERRWQATVRPLYASPDGAAGTPTGVVGVAVDVTDRRERAQLDGAMLVARTVAHELNNALSPISGFADLLKEDPAIARSPQATAYATLIADGAQQLAEKILRLQRIVRLEVDTSPLGPDQPVLDLERSVR